MEKNIQEIVRDFLEGQFSEEATSISVFLHGDLLVVYCKGCFSPAEQQMAHNELQSNLLLEFKEKELEQAMIILRDCIEKTTGHHILNIDSIVGLEGTRLLHITLQEVL